MFTSKFQMQNNLFTTVVYYKHFTRSNARETVYNNTAHTRKL